MIKINDYSLTSIKNDQKVISKESSVVDSKNNLDNSLPNKDPGHDEKEKLGQKYQRFINDAFDNWDDFTVGIRYRAKELVLPEDDFTSDTKEDNLNSRNPIKARQIFQGTMRNSTKIGFNINSKQNEDSGMALSITCFNAPIGNKLIIKPMRSSNMPSSNNRKVGLIKPHRQSPILMNSVLSKYISKSIVVSVSLIQILN